ncbi:hypothetical protein M231_04186 [Tremella mesenterica]|uniref:PH domain-containing protein n=1 Tax=Tremella mesenterica TaxID=5217 RepID=A0A4Q1BLB2_TREME|nr:hypothetical protein M231_04186 [Tremella mesenterica]
MVGSAQPLAPAFTPVPVPVPPPSKSEIQRKLSQKASVSPRLGESPKKPKKPIATGPPSAYHPSTMSGNESDTSSVTSSVPPAMTSPNHPTSPILTPATGSVGGLSAIAERKGSHAGSAGGFDDEMELEDVEEGDEEASGSDEEGQEGQGELKRGLEGERVVKSGFLYKKQERRKAWKKKWFVLRTGKLAYYKDNREYSLSRVIDLDNVHTVAPVLVKKHPFTFGIVTSKRTFLAKANSQDEMDDWVRSINTVRRRLSEQREDERTRRERGSSTATAMSVSHSEHQPLSTPTLSSSPTTHTGGYFIARQPSAYSPQQVQSGQSISLHSVPPPSPEATRSISSQLASLSIGPSPSMSGTLGSPRRPSGGFTGIQGIARSVSDTPTRGEPSASSYSSTTGPLSASPHKMQIPAVSSDEDDGEPYFSDPQAAFPSQLQRAQSQSPQQILSPPMSPVDPNKIILNSYLMKRSKGRGRRMWRKRWFYLTSQGLTYTKSHMDLKPLRFIPLSSVLDALETSTTPSDTGTDTDSPIRQNTFRRQGESIRRSSRDKVKGEDDHMFRIITAKRTFVLCAPGEEDEIKWLAAFRALLNRERSSLPSSVPPTQSQQFHIHHHQSHDQHQIHDQQTQTQTQYQSPKQIQNQMIERQVPFIMAQPPTPAGVGSMEETISSPTTQGPPITDVHEGKIGGEVDRGREERLEGIGGDTGVTGLGMGQSSLVLGMRGRSATYTAKSAVAEVVRRFHPEHSNAHEGQV